MIKHSLYLAPDPHFSHEFFAVASIQPKIKSLIAILLTPLNFAKQISFFRPNTKPSKIFKLNIHKNDCFLMNFLSFCFAPDPKFLS